MPLDGNIAHDDGDDANPFAKVNENSRIMFAVGERRLGWQGLDGATYYPAPSHKALIRMHENKPRVLAVVGSSYKLIHNKELFSAAEGTMCKEMRDSDLRGVQVREQVAGWGKMCFREYIFPNIKCRLKSHTKSEIAFRLIVQNGYGGSALRIHAGAIDFYCTNGMIRGEYQSEYRKHTGGLVVSGLGATVGRALKTFADSQDTWQRWADTPVRHQDAMELFKDLASSESLATKLGDQYLRETDQRGHNLWSVYSAMTYYASHADGEFGLRASVSEQDSAASVMLQRELSVSKWVSSKEWRQLETA